MGTEPFPVIPEGILTAADDRYGRTVFRPAAEGVGEEFANEDSGFEHLVIADVDRAVAAHLKNPSHQIALGQHRAHRQIQRRVFAIGGVTADSAFRAALRQRVHTAHTKSFLSLRHILPSLSITSVYHVIVLNPVGEVNRRISFVIFLLRIEHPLSRPAAP